MSAAENETMSIGAPELNSLSELRSQSVSTFINQVPFFSVGERRPIKAWFLNPYKPEQKREVFLRANLIRWRRNRLEKSLRSISYKEARVNSLRFKSARLRSEEIDAEDTLRRIHLEVKATALKLNGIQQQQKDALQNAVLLSIEKRICDEFDASKSGDT